jgi:murein DD-endopeptidase MepM/ murein hydrolase activator NlpD
MLNRKARLIDEIIDSSLRWLQDSNTYTSPAVKCSGANSAGGKFFINIMKMSAFEIVLQEVFDMDSGDVQVYRVWKFSKEESWGVFSLDKNGKPVFIRNLISELEDLLLNINRASTVVDYVAFQSSEDDEELTGGFEIPDTVQALTGRMKTIEKILNWRGWNSTLLPIAVIAFLMAAGIGADYFLRANTEKNLMVSYSEKFEAEYNRLGQKNIERLQGIEDELHLLKNQFSNLLNNQRDVTYFTLLRMKEEMSKYSPYRKEAYSAIAENIKQSITFAEIQYELSFNPSTEAAARKYLKESKGILNHPMSTLSIEIPGMGYPVQIEGREVDGKGFRIQKQGKDQNQKYVEIINVSNIAFISESGHFVRDSENPGNIISVEDGVVESVFKSEIYGWCIEISHTVKENFSKKYPDVKFWTSFYGNLLDEPDLKVGDAMSKGSLLGRIGNSGNNSSPALYFETRFFSDKGKESSYLGSYNSVYSFKNRGKK